VNVKIWRGLAGVLALVIGVYLAGSWIGLPGVAVGDVIGMCEQPYLGWHIWRVCPDRAPRTTELAGAGIGLIAVGWVFWIMARRVGRGLARDKGEPSASAGRK
jgi:hypothetical protein